MWISNASFESDIENEAPRRMLDEKPGEQTQPKPVVQGDPLQISSDGLARLLKAWQAGRHADTPPA
jgi:hypothetical protein